LLLGIDTCSTTGTVALARPDKEKASLLAETELTGKTYSSMLVPRIEELLRTNQVGVQHIQAIIVVHGPGSFTGIRVGLSTVKGLVEALHVPVMAISRLAVLAHKAKTKYAALDAGRGEFYFRNAALNQAQEALLSLEVLRKACAEQELAICEETAAIAFALPGWLRRDFVDPTFLDGNYLRRADAEVKFMKSASLQDR
jgi:tRNA threonylcarbamoyladenosine biosynthesis protein TsaB